MTKIVLKTPLENGQKTITELVVREPRAGALRGISLAGLADMDVDALLKLVPRITKPGITEAQAELLSLPDLIAIGGALAEKIGGTEGNADTPKP